jgi:regulator of sirC expression with transglutaminase-like and TPR domain
MYTDAVHPFDDLMALPEKHIRLGSAALWIGIDRYPDLPVHHYLRRLDHLAQRVRETAGRELTAAGRLEALAQVLATEEGFRGDEENYYDLRNAYLHTALDRRLGLPITISAIWLDVAWELGWELKAIGFPGHFLVGYRDQRGRMLIADPFHLGRRLRMKDCRELLALMIGRPVPLRRSFFRPIGVRAICFRMLANLRSIYERAGQSRPVGTDRRDVLTRMVATGVDCPETVSALADALRQEGRILPALSILHHLRQQKLSPTQTTLIRRQIADLQTLYAQGN